MIEVLSSREKDRLAGTLARIRNRNVALDEAILSRLEVKVGTFAPVAKSVDEVVVHVEVCYTESI